MKTQRKVQLTVQTIDHRPLPSEVKENTLYIGKSGYITAHKCFCGCKALIILPIEPDKWSLTEKNGKYSMTPSILNHPCKAHYVITNNVANIL